jgi:hypothetical protein
MISFSLCAVVLVGLKVTETRQLCPGANDVMHGLLTANGGAAVSPVTITVIPELFELSFLIVTSLGLLIKSTLVDLPKLSPDSGVIFSLATPGVGVDVGVADSVAVAVAVAVGVDDPVDVAVAVGVDDPVDVAVGVAVAVAVAVGVAVGVAVAVAVAVVVAVGVAVAVRVGVAVAVAVGVAVGVGEGITPSNSNAPISQVVLEPIGSGRGAPR